MTNPDSPDPSETPIDAEFEEAPPPPPRAPAGARRGVSLPWAMGIALAFLVLAAILFPIARGLWAAGEPTDEPAPPAAVADPAPDGRSRDDEIAALRAEIADLRARISAAPESGRTDAALAARVTALEQGAPNIARNEERLDVVEERLAEFADRLDQAPARDDIAALEARVVAAEARAARSPAEAAYRFAALREAASRGAPFETERAALARLRPNDAELAAMADAAASGVPTLEELRRSFPGAGIRASLAEAPPEETGRFGWLRRMFGRVVTVRRADGDPGAAERATAAAEDALAAGDIETAIAETQRLSGAAADVVAYWLGRAQARARLGARVDAVQDALAAEAAE